MTSPFVESILRFLLPFFITTAADIDAARADILETLDAYAARTRAEMLIAARIIAFSMTTLDMLSEARAAELPPALKLRYRSCANSLNRATIQSEAALAQNLQRAIPRQAAIAPPPPAPRAAARPVPAGDVPDADTQATIDHAAAAIQAHRNRGAGLHPAATPTPSQQDRTRQLWAGAMRDTLRQMGLSDGPPTAG